MSDLKNDLIKKGVTIHTREELTGFIIEGNKIKGIRTKEKDFFADEFVLAAGAVTGEVAKKLSLRIPMIGGRGYSVTFDNPPFKSTSLYYFN